MGRMAELAAGIYVPPELDEEALRVFHWRIRRFLDLGFTLRQARQLAIGPSEWHDAEKLLAHGCSRETAFDLLS